MDTNWKRAFMLRGQQSWHEDLTQVCDIIDSYPFQNLKTVTERRRNDRYYWIVSVYDGDYEIWREGSSFAMLEARLGLPLLRALSFAEEHTIFHEFNSYDSLREYMTDQGYDTPRRTIIGQLTKIPFPVEKHHVD